MAARDNRRRRRRFPVRTMAAVDVDALKEGSIAAFFELLYNVRLGIVCLP